MVSDLFTIGCPRRMVSINDFFEDASDVRPIRIHQIEVSDTTAIGDEKNLLTGRGPDSLKILCTMLCEVHLFRAIWVHDIDFAIAVPCGGEQDFLGSLVPLRKVEKGLRIIRLG